MFDAARLKLTSWYLFIIMAISLSFSFIIYRGVTLEFQRRLNTIQNRMTQGFGPRGPAEETVLDELNENFIEDLEQARHRVLLVLLYSNGIIFLMSGAASYYLAGKTLKPIEEALEEQKRFVADASHELRTPLTALKTSIEVTLRDKKLTLKDARKTLKNSLSDLDRLAKLSSDLLTLSNFQGINGSFDFDPEDIAKIANNSIKTVAPLSKKKKIQLKKSIKKVKANVHAASIEKLITILLDNAIKYTPKNGKVELKISKDSKNLKIEVSDNGIGITKHDQEHIFDRFYRADQSRSKINVAGNGLGLSQALEIVKLHGGKISVDSTPSKGSAFKVRIPLF